MLTHSLSFRRRGVAVHGPRAEEAPAQGRDRVTDARGRGVEPGRLTVETQEASARCLLAAGPPTLRPTPGLAVARAAVARGAASGVFSIILDSHVRRNAAVFPIEAVRVPKSRKILRKPRNFKQGPPRRVCTDRRQHNHVHQSVRADHCLGPRAA